MTTAPHPYTDVALRVLELPLRERRSAASVACRHRHAELALYVDLVRERDGANLNLGRLELSDPAMIELLALATA